MKKALVLGCGLIGKTVAIDLAKDFEVTVMDPSRKPWRRLVTETTSRRFRNRPMTPRRLPKPPKTQTLYAVFCQPS